MKDLKHAWKLIAVALLIGLISSATTIKSSAVTISGQAVVVAVSGLADYSNNGRDWFPIRSGKPLMAGAHIRTAKRSWVDLYLNHNGPAMRVNEESHLVLDKMDREEKGTELVTDTLVTVRDGSIAGYAKATSPSSKFVVNTFVDAATLARLNQTGSSSTAAPSTIGTSLAASPVTAPSSVRQPTGSATSSVSSATGGAIMSTVINDSKYYVKFNGRVTVDENSYVGVDVRYSPLGNAGLGSIVHVLPGNTYDPISNTQGPTGPSDTLSLIATIDTVIGNMRTFTLSKGAKVQVTPISP